VETNHDKMNSQHEKTMANLDAHHERMEACVDAWRKETAAYQEAKDVYPERREENPGEMKCVAEHEKVPKEEAEVKSLATLKQRHRDRHLAAGRRGKPKEQTQGNGGSRKKF
jgi:hypothetical protein